jgi:plastocyanin domain-containing protein
VIPAEKIQRDLPLDRPVAVDVTVPPSGKLAFTCGMGHYEGAVVAQ